MKKPTAGIGYNKSRERLVAQQKKADAVEAGLKARSAKAAKAVAIGSAALGIITLGLFTAGKIKKKRSWFS